MKLTVKRFEFNPNFTVGKLYIDDVYQCFTLEDVVRKGPKVDGKTAIPAGTYTVIVDHSSRFDRDMPHILDVPGFTGVRIHSGNTSADTEGCILVGNTWTGGDFVGNSKLAFNALFKKIIGNKVTITIE